MPLMNRNGCYALVAATLLLGTIAPLAQNATTRSDAPSRNNVACVVPDELARFDLPLPQTARRIAARQPLTIVAIGSSSTFGEGASTPEWSYPSRLRLDLMQRLPGQPVNVVNRGVNGDNDHDKRARFQRDVIALKPDAILWQLGTNSMLGGDPMETHLPVLQDGVAQLRTATRADIVLIDPQYAPKVLRGGGADAIIEMIAETARGAKVNLFRRYELMRRWREVDQLSFDKFISPDELHMNDWSYACVARGLGSAIAEAATRQ
jgi:lysophospholipase L1-like esterase